MDFVKLPSKRRVGTERRNRKKEEGFFFGQEKKRRGLGRLVKNQSDP